MLDVFFWGMKTSTVVMDVLYQGLWISKLQFLIKIIYFISVVNFFLFLVIKTLDLDSGPDLDPDPGPALTKYAGPATLIAVNPFPFSKNIIVAVPWLTCNASEYPRAFWIPAGRAGTDTDGSWGGPSDNGWRRRHTSGCCSHTACTQTSHHHLHQSPLPGYRHLSLTDLLSLSLSSLSPLVQSRTPQQVQPGKHRADARFPRESSVADPWHFSTDPDPHLWLTDPDTYPLVRGADPAIFVNDLQDGN